MAYSGKKVKAENTKKVDLFCVSSTGQVSINDFSSYFNDENVRNQISAMKNLVRKKNKELK
jgi:hypothetical protein